MGDISRPAALRRAINTGLLLAAGYVALGWMLWTTKLALLLVFAAILVAVLLRALADPVRRHTPLPGGLSLALVVALILGALGAAGWAFGAEVAAQVRTLAETLPTAWAQLQARLEDQWLGEQMQQWAAGATPPASRILAMLQQTVLGFGGALANTLIVIVGGIYIAAQHDLYRTGLLKLVPRRHRPLAADALDDSGRALRLWLLGQLVSMILIGLITGVGLWAIGVPSALALGLLAGLLEFVPIVGPIIAAIPALLLAATAGAQTALWTLGLYVVIQQIEGNLIQPMIQARAVELPPALLLFALVGFGLMFGTAGVLLAAPLTVVTFVLVKRVYVQEALDTATSIPGKPS